MENVFNIICYNTNDRFINSYNNIFKSCKLLNISDIDLNTKDLNIDDNSPLYNEYKIFKYLYENSGLFINGNFKFMYTFNSLLNNDFFIGFNDYNNISSNIIWVKNKNNDLVKKVMEHIESGKYNSLTDIFSEISNKDLKNNFNYIVKLFENSYIYPYDYFYPVDYERIGKSFSDNIKAISIDETRMDFKKKIKIRILNKIGATACEYLFNVVRRTKNNIGYKRYLFFQRLKNKVSVKDDAGIDETINTLDLYLQKKRNGEKIEYLIIHNPRWLGVTSATKELFQNLLPMQEIYLNNNVETISNKIIEIGVKQVIFSAFDYGWDKIARNLRSKDPNIKLKSFWHGSHSQVIEEINWETNLMVINLHKDGIIDVMGTCKESLVNFYKSQGYKTAFLKNTVRLEDSIKEKIKDIRKETNGKLKFGLYSAGTDWRKNTYNQVIAAASFDNAELEVVPLRYELQQLAYYNELEIVGSNSHLKRDDLLIEMAKRDIVLYVTFSECAPMLPIESLEVGTICIMGHNHHYFKNSKLHDYLVVEREDDLDAICDKVNYALTNKDEIFKLYYDWKKNNDKESEESVKEFLNM